MGSGVAAHGCELAMEKDGDAAGTFTVVAEVIGDLPIQYGREPIKVPTPHGDTIDTHVVGPIVRPVHTYGVNYLDGNATHDESTGLRKRMFDGDKFGLRFRGPGGGASDDEVIMSGYVIAWRESNPGETGSRTAEFDWQPSGPVIIDGASFGTAA